MKRRRRKFRRIRYVPRKARRRARKNPTTTTLVLLAGGGLVAYLLYKKWKEDQAKKLTAPATLQINVKGGATVGIPLGDGAAHHYATDGVRHINMSGFGGVLGSGGLGSLG